MDIVENKVARQEFSCHITGEDIDLAEPYLSINHTISVKFRKEELDEVKDFLLNQKKKDYHGIRTQPFFKSNCRICASESSGIRIIKNIGSLDNEYILNICDECVSEIVNRLEESKEIIENNFRYRDETGFYVMTSEDSAPFDHIEKDYIREETPVLYIIETPIQSISTRIRNIAKVRRMIREQKSKCHEKGLNCRRCSHPFASRVLEKIKICESCAGEIQKNLRKYEEKDKEYIITNSI